LRAGSALPDWEGVVWFMACEIHDVFGEAASASKLVCPVAAVRWLVGRGCEIAL
jgi:hypothetical protein